MAIFHDPSVYGHHGNPGHELRVEQSQFRELSMVFAMHEWPMKTGDVAARSGEARDPVRSDMLGRFGGQSHCTASTFHVRLAGSMRPSRLTSIVVPTWSLASFPRSVTGLIRCS